MKITEAQLTALEEVVVLLTIMHKHAKDPVMLCYYRFLRDNLSRLQAALTAQKDLTPMDVFRQLDLHLDN